jgi:O-antigen/teichoic acid export membrane protein
MLAVAISAPALINVVLGEQWFMAGEILRYLMPSVFMAFIASPLSEIYSVLERQKEKLVFNIAVFITRLFSLVVGGLLGDPLLAIIMYSLSGTIFWLLQCFWILRMSGIKTRKILKHVMAEVLRALPFIVLNIMAQLYYSGSPRRITLVLCISMLVFLALRWKEFLGPGTLKNAHAS